VEFNGVRSREVATRPLPAVTTARAATSAGDEAGYEVMFRRARAAAVAEAHRTDPREAVNESTYEAAHAVSDERFDALIADIIALVPARNYWGAQALARLYWPRFVEVDGYVLLAREPRRVARAAPRQPERHRGRHQPRAPPGRRDGPRRRRCVRWSGEADRRGRGHGLCASSPQTATSPSRSMRAS
jgi:hypothetical protein